MCPSLGRRFTKITPAGKLEVYETTAVRIFEVYDTIAAYQVCDTTSGISGT